MADESAPPENKQASPSSQDGEGEPLGHCAGFTKAGEPCQRKLLHFITPDGQRWCNQHVPENGEPDRLYVGPTRATSPCAGLLRDGSACEQRGNRPTKVDGREVLLCSWHQRVWEEHRVLKPPPRKRRRVETVDSEIVEPEPRLLPLTPLTPLPAEGDDALADVPQGNGSAPPPPKTLRERVEDTTDALYSDIEGGLRAALTNSRKVRKTRCPSCSEVFEVRLPDHAASISAAKALLDLVVSRPKPDVEPALGEAGAEGFDLSTLTTSQLRRYLSLTDETVIEHLDSATLAEKVERVVDVAERFMADPRDVTPSEVTQARALLTSMRHYDDALAPIRGLRVDWRVLRERESDIPPAPRFVDEGA